MIARLHRAILLTFAAVTLSACAEPRDAFIEGPKGYVEFYIPGEDPLVAELKADAAVYLLSDGQRVFQGMTLKWKKLAPARHGLVVAVPPGGHRFSVEVAGGETPVTVNLEKDAYIPVRITSSGVSRAAMLGTTNRVRFRIDATPESARQSGAVH